MARVSYDRSEHVAELLSAYLDGELESGELEAVVSHVETCLDCIAEFHGVRAMRAVLRTLPALAMPEFLLDSSHHGEELSAYLDGELDAFDRDRLVAHLDRCASCREELHELDAARIGIRSLPVLDYDTGGVIPRRRSPPRKRRTLAGLAAAAVLAGAFTLGILTSDPPGRPIDLELLASRHAARQSVDVGTLGVPASSQLIPD